MMTDNELIRCALLGDQEAQEECTEKGIALPCPCCGGEVTFDSIAAHNHLIVELPDYEGGCFVECNDCTYAISGNDKKEALKLHNSRPAPPIGRCGECKSGSTLDDDRVVCDVSRNIMLKTDFCSLFEQGMMTCKH